MAGVEFAAEGEGEGVLLCDVLAERAVGGADFAAGFADRRVRRTHMLLKSGVGFEAELSRGVCRYGGRRSG